MCQKPGTFLRLANAKAAAQSLSMTDPALEPKRSVKKCCTVGCERNAKAPPTTARAPATAGNRVAADMVEEDQGDRREEEVVVVVVAVVVEDEEKEEKRRIREETREKEKKGDIRKKLVLYDDRHLP